MVGHHVVHLPGQSPAFRIDGGLCGQAPTLGLVRPPPANQDAQAPHRHQDQVVDQEVGQAVGRAQRVQDDIEHQVPARRRQRYGPPEAFLVGTHGVQRDVQPQAAEGRRVAEALVDRERGPRYREADGRPSGAHRERQSLT
ncbi:hypothetical protein ACFU8Q_29480 [Streptomyces sp. NPDC057543]|uniref:hypothetical protein n=1 Tax=Streptomyces sp. NPDC057543 TaxID=3346163 RepID=UPI003680DCC2